MNRCFSHFTCATDTENIMKIFKDVRNNAVQGNIFEEVDA